MTQRLKDKVALVLGAGSIGPGCGGGRGTPSASGPLRVHCCCSPSRGRRSP
jgi:hypothetical protein